jgi:putative ABC transport system substrate-binding protein
MRRRKFIALLGGVVAWPLAARAQQARRVVRIGYLSFTSASQQTHRSDEFRAGLRNLGYVEGRDFQIEFRFADGDNDLLPGLAAELVRLNVDVIVTYATGVPVAQRATTTIPIVMAAYADALATRVVASLAHPGGNITGLTFFVPELMAKRLELMKEVAPTMTRAGVLLFRGSEVKNPVLETMWDTARALKVELQPIEIGGPTDVEGAISELANRQVGALVIGDHPFFTDNAQVITALAAKYRLPSVGAPGFAASGGLMGYGVNFSDMFRRAAVFVDKIIKGTKPRDIPVERATKFETVINLKTAKTIGVTLPTSTLLRADEVIE